MDNYPSVSCFLVREQNRNVDADLPLIARGLNLDLEQLRATLRRYRAAPGYQPIPIKQDITADEQAFIEAHRNELPELETIDEERRLYPRDGFAAHLIGYVGEVSEEDLNNPRYADYEPGDVVGKAGVEETYDQLLRGQDGSRDVVVDSHGREVGYLRTQHAIPGQDLKLTIDIDLQRTAELALGDANGAVVAMDPRNGEILAMVSHPSYDPNAFAVRINRKDWNELINNPNHPLMNKAIQDQLAPGSTFKIIMSAAGLQEGVAQNMHVNCVGGGDFLRALLPLRPAPRRAEYPRGHSDVLRHLLLHAGAEAGHRHHRQIRHRIRPGTEDRHRPAQRDGRRDALDAVGDEELPPAVLPRQHDLGRHRPGRDAGYASATGAGPGRHRFGWAFCPAPCGRSRPASSRFPAGHPGQLSRLGRQDGASQSRHLDDHHRRHGRRHHARLYHTAEAAHMEGIDFAGKTGTAQVVGGGDTHTKGGAKTPNSWFVGMVPRRNPEIVIAVLQEHGDWGSLSAHIAAADRDHLREQEAHGRTTTSSIRPAWASRSKWAPSGPSPRLPGRKRSDASGAGFGPPCRTFHGRSQPAGRAKSLASSQPSLPAWLLAMPLRFKEGQP